MKQNKSINIWEILDILMVIILIVSLIIVIKGVDCPENISTSSTYGLFIATACKFGFKGVIWIIVAIISLFAIIFLSKKALKS